MTDEQLRDELKRLTGYCLEGLHRWDLLKLWCHARAQMSPRHS